MSQSANSDETVARESLGERLREARRYLGLTQDEVATTVGMPRTALTDVEAGRRKVDALELSQLSRLYKQPVSYFTGDDEVSSELPPDVAHLARQAADLSETDRAELGRFAEYLKSRSELGEE